MSRISQKKMSRYGAYGQKGKRYRTHTEPDLITLWGERGKTEVIFKETTAKMQSKTD